MNRRLKPIKYRKILPKPKKSTVKRFKEIYRNLSYIKKNWLVISFMGLITISTFNSVVYFALNHTQVINAVLVLAAIPAAVQVAHHGSDGLVCGSRPDVPRAD